MFYFFSRLFQRKKYNFFKYHIGAVILFALLYWIQDKLIYLYPTLGTYLGYIDNTSKQNTDINSLYYWFWFSLVTQTTVGYHGPMSEKMTGVSFKKIPPNIVYTNILQLLSILLITAHIL